MPLVLQTLHSPDVFPPGGIRMDAVRQGKFTFPNERGHFWFQYGHVC